MVVDGFFVLGNRPFVSRIEKTGWGLDKFGPGPESEDNSTECQRCHEDDLELEEYKGSQLCQICLEDEMEADGVEPVFSAMGMDEPVFPSI